MASVPWLSLFLSTRMNELAELPSLDLLSAYHHLQQEYGQTNVGSDRPPNEAVFETLRTAGLSIQRLRRYCEVEGIDLPPPTDGSEDSEWAALARAVSQVHVPWSFLEKVTQHMHADVATFLDSELMQWPHTATFLEWCSGLRNAISSEFAPSLVDCPLPPTYTPIQLAFTANKYLSAAQLLELGAPLHPSLFMRHDQQFAREVVNAAMSNGMMRAAAQLHELMPNVCDKTRTVNLTGLGLSTVPPLLELWTSLESVDFSKNKLDMLPVWMKRLENVVLADNPFSLVPRGASQSWAAMRAHLQHVSACAERWPQVKITSVCLTPYTPAMVATLGGVFNVKAHDLEEGLADISTFKTSLDDHLDLSLYVIPDGLWLQSSQLCPSSGRVFLTLSTKYTIIYEAQEMAQSATTIDALKLLLHRIKMLENYYNCFPKIIICEITKAGVPVSSLGKELMQLYSHIPFFTVENKADSHRAVRSYLSQSISKRSNSSFPEPWAHVATYLSSATVDAVPKETLNKWFATCGVPEAEWLSLQEHLTRTGYIFGWRPCDPNDSHIVINPKCLASTLKLLRSETVAGFLSSECIAWSSGNVSPHSDRLTALSLKFFEEMSVLIFSSISLNELVVVPHLLEEKMRSIASLWSLPDALEHRRIYRFKHITQDFFHLFQVTVLRAAQVTLQRIWRYGMLVSRNGAIAVVTACYKRCEIVIKAKSRRMSKMPSDSLFFFLIEMLESLIDNEVKGVLVERLVPCIHCLRHNATPWEFKFSDLVTLMARGTPFAYCTDVEVPSRCVQISHLAPDVTLSSFKKISPGDISQEEFLGRGAFGVVKKAIWKGHCVAVKEPITGTDPQELLTVYRDVLKEASIMSSLKSPYLVRFYGVATPLRLVMEFVPCGDLYHLLHSEAHASLSLSMKLRLMVDIARAMNYLQSISPPIIHRDLRSPNIFIQSLDVRALVCAKVADFGMSLQAFAPVQESLMAWQWLAPEVLKGEPYDSSSDVYSFGMVMYEILAGRVPFDEYITHESYSRDSETENGQTIRVFDVHEMKRHIFEYAVRPTPPPAAPPALCDVMRRCWVASPSARPSFSVLEKILSDAYQTCLDKGADALQDFVPDYRCAMPTLDLRLEPLKDTDDELTEPDYTSYSASRTHHSPTHEQDDTLLTIGEHVPCSFSLSCLFFVPDTSEVWCGGKAGMVVVVALPSGSVVVVKRFPVGRIVNIKQRGSLCVCIAECGQVVIMSVFDYAHTAVVPLARLPDFEELVVCTLVAKSSLWLSCPPTDVTLVYALPPAPAWERGREAACVAELAAVLSATAPTHTYTLTQYTRTHAHTHRVSLVDDEPRLLVSRKPLRSGRDDRRAALPVVCIDAADEEEEVVLCCARVILVLNKHFQELKQVSFDASAGRITAVLCDRSSFLAGTFQGIVYREGEHAFTMQSRVVCIRKYSENMYLLLGNDGSLITVKDVSLTPVNERRIECTRNACVDMTITPHGIVYGLYDGELHRVYERSHDGLFDLFGSQASSRSLEELSEDPLFEDCWWTLITRIVHVAHRVLPPAQARTLIQSCSTKDMVVLLFTQLECRPELTRLLELLQLHHLHRKAHRQFLKMDQAWELQPSGRLWNFQYNRALGQGVLQQALNNSSSPITTFVDQFLESMLCPSEERFNHDDYVNAISFLIGT